MLTNEKAFSLRLSGKWSLMKMSGPVAGVWAWRTPLVYTAKNHTLFGAREVVKNQIKEIFGTELNLKDVSPLNSFVPGCKIQ